MRSGSWATTRARPGLAERIRFVGDRLEPRLTLCKTGRRNRLSFQLQEGHPHPRAVFDVRRFRPNFLIGSPEEFEGLPELSWCGKRVRAGQMIAACAIPTPRCGMPTQPQPGLDKDPSVLRTIVRQAGQNVGVYADVASLRRVCVGDGVELLDGVKEPADGLLR
jgi:uncharacterized protein YcbX